MTERLIRIALAFVVAFVFAGRMEAAAAHCARLAQAEAAEAHAAMAPAEALPCHDMKNMGADQTAQPEPHPSRHHDKAGDRCECVGVLKACAGVTAVTTSAHIEPYEWARPEAAAFASIEPSPDWRPPRA